MLKKIFSFLLFTCFIINTYGQRTEYYFRFIENNRQTINNFITNIISIDKIVGDTVYAYASQKEFEKFKTLGYIITELPHPSSLAKVAMATTVAQMANWDKYPTYQVYRQMMKNFEINYPSLCKLDSIGSSIEGRKLYVVKISDNVSQNEPEPEFFYTSTIHGDETTGFVLMLRLIDYLLANYGTNARVTNLVNNMAIYINPAANPDGTYSPSDINIDGATRYNANSVDLNRNFPDWRAGQHPDGNSWQIETQHFMNFAQQRHFVMSANFHGGIELVNYPWDTYTTAQNPHADNDWYYAISRNYADSCHTFGPSGYFTGENNGVTQGGDWYVITGGRQDYMNYYHHCREVTIELSNTKLLNPAQLPTMWTANKASFLTYMERCLYGFHGTVKNPSDQPLQATVFIQGHDKDNSFVTTNPENGDYYRPINPGTYQVTFSAEGYISQTVQVIVPSLTSSIIQDIVLQPAQQVNISGVVTASANSLPLENAKIELLQTSFPAVYTNAQGYYTMNAVYENTYQIKVSKAGYTSVIQTINVSSSNHVFNFQLDESLAESFENGLPAGFTTTGAGWATDNTVAYDGSVSLRSAAIPNSSSTSVSVQLNILTSGNIEFYKKVSSEAGYDKLKFYIDGSEKGNWSGNVDWSIATFPVTTGIHTFRWEYSKDGSSVSGSDCAWIDYISFPVFGVNVTFNVTSNSNPIQDATVNFNQAQMNTAANGQVTFTSVPRANNLPYTITKSGYLNNQGYVTTMYQNLTVNVNMVSTQEHFNITFHVTDGTNPVAGANVSFAGFQQLTSSNGETVFNNIPATNNLPYTITAQGFETASGTVNADADKTVNIALTPVAQTYTVTFNISDNNGPVNQAVISLNNITNPQGDYVFSNISPGSYSYLVVCEGYEDAAGNITVINSDITVDVVLQQAVPEYLVNFRLDMSQAAAFNPATDELYISGTMNNWAAPGSNSTFKLTQGDNLIYEIHLVLREGQYQYKFYKNTGWSGAEWVGNPVRILNLVSDTVLLHHWGNLTSVNNLLQNRIIIYPNPASENVYIHLENPADGIYICDITGKKLQCNIKKISDLEYLISAIQPGLYIAHFKSGNKSFAQKFRIK